MRTDSVTAQLGTEKISKLLARYALPSIIAMTAASLYNIVDSIFIGHGIGALALSGLGITMPLMNLAAAFGSLVGAGAAALLSIKLGQSDTEGGNVILGNTVTLNLILGVAFAVVSLLWLEPILYLFGASPDTIGYATEYMRILLLGNIVTHLYLGLNNMLRASGHPNKSMVAMLMAVCVNVVLDAIFILWFGWGIAGAAWATVIAQCTSLIYQSFHFRNKNNEIHFKKHYLRLRAKIVRGIMSIGMAPFLMNVTSCVVVIFINNALRDTGGDIYIGAYGIINRVAMIFLMVVFGITQGMQPILGFNFGARNFERVRNSYWLGMKWAMTMTVLGFLFCMLHPGAIATVFTTDQILTAATKEGLQIVMLAFPVVGFQIVTTQFFQSIGDAKKAIVLSLTRQLIFLLPLLIILPPLMGSRGVWYCFPISDFASATLALVLLLNKFRKFRKEESLQQNR